MRYYIKAFYGNWVETDKKHYKEFRKQILIGANNIDKNNTKEVEEFLSHHSKKEEN